MKRRTAFLAGGVGAILALGLTVVGCSVAEFTFRIDATHCPPGAVYEVVGEFKDNPQNDPTNRWTIRSGTKRLVFMFPPGSSNRERIEVKVYEVLPQPTPTPNPGPLPPMRRLIKETIITVNSLGPITQTVEICSAPSSTP